MKMKTIDWNKASELGLIRRINEEVLHPLGLAITRDPKTGSSNFLVIAPDLKWEYSKPATTTMDDSQIKSILSSILEQDQKLN